MPKTPLAVAAANTVINPSLLAFKPRQLLLLSNSNMKPNNTNNKTLTLKPDQKALLGLSIAQYLEHNGFSKTLKKFQSEAHIVKDDLSASSPDLEEIYCKYLETRSIRTEQVSPEVLKEATNNIVSKSQLDEPDKKSKDKKKKKSKLDSESLDDNVQHKQLESLPGATEEKSKDKKKKKNKLTSDTLVDNVEQSGSEDKQVAGNTKFEEVECLKDSQEVNVTDVPLEDKSVKSKAKKKKKGGSENLSARESEKLEKGKSDRTDTKKDDLKNSEEDVANKENKGIKKRKRSASEENDSQPAGQNAVEESKRRKTEGSKDPKGSEQPTKVNEETSIKKLDALTNGNLEKSGEKSALQKTMKKQQNGSAEPKTIKPFQRVKVDEVEFTDERLQDNSYWAKDGAESGYGAKAQEVLGQVRGRGFRHEKTKKKRGSYRGGQIDVQSHSIKFNYSDDE